ncbi:hypothetical protein [Flavobacterium capsici]|uniref:Uncharacterized protein n=1 Tax=Flavobacterium capsici TaxID=3075618 RepID=A0AA96J574_9FLAO|nr:MULTISPECIES: hypothetical protein [unclassified Flavobacterium]WNM18163.1 hypothetical protein RN608_09070 [Flavobacterium sp. PMR2A8]WNM22215.1 hypothetical protein RN605_02370 [Flavobacterium sp. PMTSA4]
MTYNSKNFHKHTFCLWQEIHFSDIENQSISHKSKSGSQYIFTETGVYRISNHWGRAANCRWRLIPLENYKNQQTKVGFAKWTNFHPNNETDNLFFIEVNFTTTEVTFNHKDTSTYNETFTLRNATDTAKTIKTIKEILKETAWAKHLTYDSIENLRKEIINQLITTNSSFLDIKKQFTIIT